ncbi:MAG TPA: flagellar assembly protein FliW [Thermosynergistes sp.]|nr:flagellar assembly protein FliW [Thermosynergistes sp.]
MAENKKSPFVAGQMHVREVKEMRAIKTLRFGALQISEEDIVRFPKGIPGFADHREWVFAGDEDSPIKWLQSLKDGDVALPVAPPELILADYDAKVYSEDIKELEASSAGELALLVVITIPPDEPWEATANMRAPIVINVSKRLAKQVIAQNEEYAVAHPLFDEATREAMASGSHAAPEEAHAGGGA